MTIYDFAHFGLFIIASFLFAFGTGIIGALTSDFTDEWTLTAWLTAIFVYGITFSLLFEIK